ncbi:MAG: hypothetical protein LUG46_02145 [Erysipelotrichaceae bacterium]|nr:hypothetical protein [Erysipelotrichaceae bacterium]
MHAKRKQIRNISYVKAYFNSIWPIDGVYVVQPLYNILDGMFVSNISENALTATSLAYPIQLMMLAVAIGTGVGVNSLLSRMLGKRDCFFRISISTYLFSRMFRYFSSYNRRKIITSY